jgi:hypothetical protein
MPTNTDPKTDSEQSDPHISVSFSIPVSVKEDMDRRAKRLRLSRTDYIKLIVLWDLDKGEDAPFDFPRKPRPEPEAVPVKESDTATSTASVPESEIVEPKKKRRRAKA